MIHVYTALGSSDDGDALTNRSISSLFSHTQAGRRLCGPTGNLDRNYIDPSKVTDVLSF